ALHNARHKVAWPLPQDELTVRPNTTSFMAPPPGRDAASEREAFGGPRTGPREPHPRAGRTCPSKHGPPALPRASAPQHRLVEHIRPLVHQPPAPRDRNRHRAGAREEGDAPLRRMVPHAMIPRGQDAKPDAAPPVRELSGPPARGDPKTDLT